MRRPCVAVIAAVLLAASRSFAAACELSAPETATVASIQDGETLTLADGRTVRLIGAKAPLAPLGWRGDDPWPFVDEARDALAKLASGATVELRFDARRKDRHGHLLAQVFVVADGNRLWLQEALIAQGLARVYSLPDTASCVAELLAAETQARAKRVGLWSSWAYRIEDARDTKRLGRLTHSYQLVEGTVHAMGEGRKWIYVDFEEDWRRDFTIAIARENLGAFETAGMDLKSLAGRRVRVRGWVSWWNGPMIEANHPQQIEVLASGPGL